METERLKTNGSPAGDMAIIVFFAALVLFPSFAVRELWTPDEPRYMEVAREMVVTGDYVVPHLNGELYPDKPPIFFWLAAGFYKLGCGYNSGRLVAALAAIVTLLLTYSFARRTMPRPGPVISALATLTLLLFIEAKAGLLDPLLTLFVVASLLAGHRALQPETRRRTLWWLGAYALAALAVLTKGPVGLVVPALVLLAYGVANRRRVRCGARGHVFGAVLLLGMVASWLAPMLVKCSVAHPEYLQELHDQVLGRVVQSYSHRNPFYYFLVRYPMDLFPWMLVFTIALVRSVWPWERIRTAEGRPAAVTLISWAAIVVGVAGCAAMTAVAIRPERVQAFKEAETPLVEVILWSVLSGAAGVAAGIAMLRGRHWGRVLFLFAAPVSLVLGQGYFGFHWANVVVAVSYVIALVFLVRPAAASFFGARKHERDARVQFVFFWVVWTFLFFSVVSGKRQGYLMPMAPAVGLLVGWYLSTGARDGFRWEKWLSRAFYATFIIWAVLGAAIAVSMPIFPKLAPKFLKDGEQQKDLLASVMGPGTVAVGILVGIVILAMSIRGIRLVRNRAGALKAARWILVIYLFVSLAADVFIAPRVNRFKSPRSFCEAAKPYLAEADEAHLLRNDMSGVYNLYTGLVAMPALTEQDQTLAILSGRSRVAIIGEQKYRYRLVGEACRYPIPVRTTVGSRAMELIINWDPATGRLIDAPPEPGPNDAAPPAQ